MNHLRDAIGWCQDAAEAIYRYARETNTVALYLHYRRDCKNSHLRAVRRTFEVLF